MSNLEEIPNVKQEFWDAVPDVWEGLEVTGVGAATATTVPSPTASFLEISVPLL